MVPLVLSSPTEAEPTPGVDGLQRLLCERARGNVQTFEQASFHPHGLDDRWTGLRWFGGWGRSDDEVTRLQLAHGDAPLDRDAPQLRVETQIARRGYDSSERAPLEELRREMAVEQVMSLFHGSEAVPDDVRRAAFPRRPTSDDPSAPWDEIVCPIDGTPTPFRVLTSGASWVAHAVHGEVVIGIEATNWSKSTVRIVTVTDLTGYERGSLVVHQRMRDRGSGG